MEGISHRTLLVNGINMHIAEKGEGPVVILIHGFPELWYSWRHQILSLAARGYHAVAPDLRGFGDSEAPSSTASYSILHVVGDIVTLIDALSKDQVFVVGHDWGAMVAWWLCVLRPDKVKALVNLSVAYSPRNPKLNPVSGFRAIFGDDHYICRFQEQGVIEAEFEQIGTATLVKKFLAYRTPAAIIVPKDKGFAETLETPASLPSWLTEEDIDYFVSKFEKSGFTGGLNYYRCMILNIVTLTRGGIDNVYENVEAETIIVKLQATPTVFIICGGSWELTAPWTGVQVKVPTKFIIGDLDLTYHTPGIQDYIHKGAFKKLVPLLDDVVVMEGVGHFINQEKPHEISDLIYDFIQKF